MLSYYLPQENPGGVQIAIWDAAGKTVRTLFAPSQAGLNRACWDLRREPAMPENAPPTAASCVAARSAGGPLAPPGKYTVVLTPAGALPMKSELVVQPDPRSRVSEADRRGRESALSSAYTLQRQLSGVRQTAQTLGIQIAAMRGTISGEGVALLERAGRDVARAMGQVNTAIAGAARAQNAIDLYEGLPTAAQLRELDWAWEDAVEGATSVNRVIEGDMPELYAAAGPSARWSPLKPVLLPKR